MRDEMLAKKLRHALDAELSGLYPSALDRSRILDNAIGGRKVKRKLTVGLVLAIVLTLITAAAVAVTLALLTVSTILINPLRYNGLLSFPFAFFEIAVAAVEGTVYAIAFKRYEYRETYRPWLAVLYAVIANLITYVIGAYLCFLPV